MTKRSKSLAAKVRAAMSETPTATAKEIAALLQVSLSRVYNVMWAENKKKQAAAPKQAEPKQAEPKQETPEQSANATQHGGDHYKTKAVQPWDFIVANNLGYLEGNVVKYVSRWKDKGGVLDLKKARHYLDKLIETAEH